MTKRSQQQHEEFRASICAKKWMDGLNDRLVACSLLIDQAGKSIEAKQDDSPAEILDSGKLWRALLDLDQARNALNEVIKKIERVSNQPLANG